MHSTQLLLTEDNFNSKTFTCTCKISHDRGNRTLTHMLQSSTPYAELSASLVN